MVRVKWFVTICSFTLLVWVGVGLVYQYQVYKIDEQLKGASKAVAYSMEWNRQKIRRELDVFSWSLEAGGARDKDLQVFHHLKQTVEEWRKMDQELGKLMDEKKQEKETESAISLFVGCSLLTNQEQVDLLSSYQQYLANLNHLTVDSLADELSNKSQYMTFADVPETVSFYWLKNLRLQMLINLEQTVVYFCKRLGTGPNYFHCPNYCLKNPDYYIEF